MNRFGCQINYSKPDQKEFFTIVKELAHRCQIPMSDEELEKEANIWELRHNGMSGRSAQQLINHLKGLTLK